MSQEFGGIDLRLVDNSDSQGIIGLIARCFAAYPGCLLDVDGEEPALRTPADSFEQFWVAVDAADRVVGTIAVGTHAGVDGSSTVELKKLYVDPECRGQGLARRLVDLVENYARNRDIPVVDLWTDTRFETAHAVYTRLGYERRPDERELGDLSDTRELYFSKRVSTGDAT